MKPPKGPVLTVDGAVLEGKKVILVKRSIPPFIDYWVLPGGHVDYGERVEEAMKRELREELGISVEIKRLIGIYSDPKRDPRYHTTSAAYLCQKKNGKIRLNKEGSEFRHFSLNNLPKKIGFDHRKILNDLKKMTF